MEIDQFVLDNVFFKIETEEDGVVYWRECAGEGEGYIILWEGEHLSHHHTYRHPETIYGR